MNKLNLILATLALILIGWFVSEHNQIVEFKPSIDIQSQGNDLQLTIFNQGVKEYFLIAKKAQNNLDKTIKLQNINLKKFNLQNNQIEWQITADQGSLTNEKILNLTKNVKAISYKELNLQFNSENILFNLQTKHINSNTKIIIYNDTFSSQGIGLQGNLITKKFEILNNIQTTIKK